MRLLLVEDDKKIAAFVIRGLKEEGYVVDHASDGVEGLHLALDGNYDAAIIDLMLPQMDGLSLIRELRRNQRKTPVIVLSARREVEERVRCLQAGSDDYLVKPFAFSELLARIQALLRRASSTHPAAGDGTKLVVGDLELDYVKRTVIRGGQRIELQPREFSLLEYMMRNAAVLALKDTDSRARLGLSLRSADQRGGRARLPPAEQARPGFRDAIAAHSARSGLCS